MELFSRGKDGSDNGTPAYGINVGPHEFAAACFISDKMADLIVASANIFAMAARDMGGTPLEIATAIGGNLADIGKALVWGREALEQARELIEETGQEWPPQTWDNTHGIPGHALHLIAEALELFPPIEFIQPVDEQAGLIREMADMLKEQVVTEGEDNQEIAARALIARAQEMLGDQ